MKVPLPPRYDTTLRRGGPVDVWCAEDMHAFGCARAAEMKERCAKLLDEVHKTRKHLDNYAAFYANVIRNMEEPK